MNLRTQVAQLIKELRKEAGLTQLELGEKIQCSSEKITTIEIGARRLSLDDVQKIAKALDVEVCITIVHQQRTRHIVI